jgi:hypothetical protein
MEIRNVHDFTVQDCLVTSDLWNITDSSDGHLLDNQVNALPGIAGQASILVIRAPRLRFELNKLSDIALTLLASDDIVVSDNRFGITPGHPAVSPFHVGLLQGANIQILRNDFDGGWDGVMLYPNLQNTVDDAVMLKDATNALVRHNYMKNYWDAGVEWMGRLEGSVVQDNVIVNTGFTAIGGWYWGSVSDTRFMQNLADRTSDLFRAATPVDASTLAATADSRRPVGLFQATCSTVTSCGISAARHTSAPVRKIHPGCRYSTSWATGEAYHPYPVKWHRAPRNSIPPTTHSYATISATSTPGRTSVPTPWSPEW